MRKIAPLPGPPLKSNNTESLWKYKMNKLRSLRMEKQHKINKSVNVAHRKDRSYTSKIHAKRKKDERVRN